MSTTPTTCPHCGIPDKMECTSWQGSRRSICYERQISALKAELEQAKADRARAAMEERNKCLATMERQKGALEKAREKLDAAQRSMPAFHEGGFYFERHDMDGNYIGSENVDPIAVVQGLDQAVTDSISAITAALEAQP